jgi:hypothetical protein
MCRRPVAGDIREMVPSPAARILFPLSRVGSTRRIRRAKTPNSGPGSRNCAKLTSPERVWWPIHSLRSILIAATAAKYRMDDCRLSSGIC